MTANVGDRVVAVLYVKDNVVYLMGEGVYLGKQVPEDTAPGGEFFQKLGIVNPAIKLDNGHVVYGFECWWGPVGLLETKFKGCKVEVVPVSQYRPAGIGEDGVPSL